MRRLSGSFLLMTLTSMSLLLSVAAPADAQKPTKPLPYRPASADSEFKTERLTAPMALPDVPPYTGQIKFLSGLKYPHDSTGQRTTMTIGVNEVGDQVLDWYRQALTQYQWKILPQAQDMKMVSAMKGGNTFSVIINPSRGHGYRTVVVLNYKYGK